MKKINPPFILSLIFYIIYKTTSHLSDDPILSLLIFIVPITFLITNLILRKRIKFKSWFLSKLNIFLDKETFIITSDIPSSLLYQKVLLIIDESKFNRIDSITEKLQILASTSPNFWTWGENIYIEITQKDNSTSEIKITSITIFGSYSWNRNNKNHQVFCQLLEQSLTI